MSDYNVVDIRTRKRRGKPEVEQCWTCGCGGQQWLLVGAQCVCLACNMVNLPLKVTFDRQVYEDWDADEATRVALLDACALEIPDPKDPVA